MTSDVDWFWVAWLFAGSNWFSFSLGYWWCLRKEVKDMRKHLEDIRRVL